MNEFILDYYVLFFFFFFKQKTAYEIYQCDWSSDVCSSDLPCSGPAAVVLITLVLIIKFAALETLINHKQWNSIILAPILGRTILPMLFLTTPYVREAGLGSALTKHLPRTPAWTVIAIVLLCITFITGFNSVLLIASALITLVALRILMLKRIDGTTGDTAGATVELTEMVVLVVSVLVLL